MSDVTIRRLHNLDLFEGLGRRDLEKVDRLVTTLVIPAGRTLCVEGRPGAEFVVMIDGLANLHSVQGDAALLGAGAWFGECALIDNAPRRATVTAVTESMVLVFGRREFNTMLADFPTVRARVEQRRIDVLPHDPVLVRDAVLSR